jgi:hypothetical protein
MISFVYTFIALWIGGLGYIPLHHLNLYNNSVGIKDNVQLLKVEELPGSFREVYKTWDKLDENGKKALLENIFNQDKYWGYFFSTWGKYYFYTENSRVLRILKEAIVITGTKIHHDGVVQTSAEISQGHWYRETFARNMRLLLEAYSYSQNPLVLELVDTQTSQWMDKNVREKANGFMIYPYSAQLKNSRSSEINVNQNLQMGLVFSKLYFEPESKFYLNETIRKIALDEINASLSLFRNDGFIPLNQHAAHVGDSNYAGLSTSILYELVQIWGHPSWINYLQQSGRWLEKSFDENRPWNAKTDGKDYHFDQFSAYNLFSRIPAFYAAGISTFRAKEWMNFVASRFTNFDILDLVPRWDHLQSLPEHYYSEKVRTKNLKVLPPSIYAEINQNILKINIVASEVEEIVIAQQRKTSFSLENSFFMRFKNGDKIKVKDAQLQESVLEIPKKWVGKEWKVEVCLFDFNHPINQR